MSTCLKGGETMTTVIIVALSVTVIAEAFFLIKYKLVCETFAIWIVDKGFPLPSEEELEQATRQILNKKEE